MKIPFKNRIIVDGPGKYCGRVEGLLNAIDRTTLGRALFTEISTRSKAGKRLTIRSHGGGAGDAEAKAANLRDAARAGLRLHVCSGPESGKPMYWAYTNARGDIGVTTDRRRALAPPVARREHVFGLLNGRGVGSDVMLRIDPDHYPKRLAGATLTLKADEVMVHELVHGMRQMQGLVACTLNVPTGYENDEEFWGITIANVYRSEKARGGGGVGEMRSGDHSKLNRMLEHPETFYRDPTTMKMIERFFRDHRTFSTTIAKKVVAGFNPFAIALRSKPGLEAGR